MIKIPELLAPASGWQQLKAAVNNGADAVYSGGALFNARMKADNFSMDDMGEAIAFAHERGVKVYVTLNTLIRDSEMAKAFAYAADLWEAGADGLIIQDIGLGRLIHKYIPDMHMHLSTQGTAYNRWAVDMARDLGYRRIVPAREITLEEMRVMADACHEKDMEVEVFVHGALCMCYSGQCQMSRRFGGRSGNRGLCAQPCRLMYRDGSGRESYALSPKDLCLVGELPALCGAGVDSLKIEGRLKSPEYVAVVTGIYRKYLDRYADMLATGIADEYAVDEYSVDSEDMDKLRQIFNRGDFTTGYLYGNPKDALLSGTSPKNRGLYAGRVAAVRDAAGKGARDGRKLIDIDTNGSETGLAAGDGIELPETGNVITYIEKISGNITRAGDFKGSVSIGDEVRKVTDRGLCDEAAATFSDAADKYLRKEKIDMRFTASVGREPLLEVFEGGAGFHGSPIAEVTAEQKLEKAVKRPADPERIEEQIRKLGGTPFEAGDAEVRIYGEPMVPVSLVNSMRREAVEMILRERREVVRESLSKDRIKDIIKMEGIPDVPAEGVPDVPAEIKGRRLVPLESFMESGFDREDAIPYILNVSKGALDSFIEDHFEEIVSAVGSSGIAIGNLGWIRRFLERGVTVYGDYGLNIFNEQAAKAFEEAGVKVICMSDEMSTDGRHVPDIPREPEIMRRVPLMITEHPLETDFLTDRKNARHDVMKWHSGDKYLLF